MIAEKCGQFLLVLRKERSLTQKQVADHLHVTDKAVSRWETGKGLPDIDSLVMLSDLFDVTINELLNGERLTAEQFEKTAEHTLTDVLTMHAKTEKRTRRLTLLTGIIGCLFVLLIVASGIICWHFYTHYKSDSLYYPQDLMIDLMSATTVSVQIKDVEIADDVDFLMVSRLRIDDWEMTDRPLDKTQLIATITTQGDMQIELFLFENGAYATLKNYAYEQFSGTYCYPDNMILTTETLQKK